MPILKINIQERNSIISEIIISFHDHLIIISSFILAFLLYWTCITPVNSKSNNNFQEENAIEYVWTLIPICILIFTSIPSILILFIIEENFKTDICLKIQGNQWYWEYQFINKNKISFSSYIANSNLIRNIYTSNSIPVPFKTKITIILSSNDVIHSWSIPSLRLKCDAIPGRINSINIIIKKPCILTGQCSEICGINHRFIPILIKSIKNFNY